MNEYDQVKTLEEQLPRTRELLNQTVDTLQEERRLVAMTKNHVVVIT